MQVGELGAEKKPKRQAGRRAKEEKIALLPSGIAIQGICFHSLPANCTRGQSLLECRGGHRTASSASSILWISLREWLRMESTFPFDFPVSLLSSLLRVYSTVCPSWPLFPRLVATGHETGLTPGIPVSGKGMKNLHYRFNLFVLLSSCMYWSATFTRKTMLGLWGKCKR